MQALAHLRSLVLVYKPCETKAHDYNVFGTLTRLTHLTASAYTKDEDLLQLSNLTNLLSLDVGSYGYSYSMTSNAFDALKGMTRLTYFYSPGSGWNPDCSEKISHLTNLKVLMLEQGGSSAKFAGAHFLSNLTNLEQATLSFHSIPSEEFEHVKHWTNLTSLKLSKLDWNVCFDHVSSLTKLRTFTLSNFKMAPDLLVTLAKLPDLQKIIFSYHVNWLPEYNDIDQDHVEHQEAANGDEILDDPWDQLSALTSLTNLRRLYRLPYHSALNTRITFFPPSITDLNVVGLKGKTCSLFINSLQHFTRLDKLTLNGEPESITSDTIEILAKLKTLRHLHIDSDHYDYYSYKAWKQRRDNPKPGAEATYYEQLKYKCYSQLSLSAFSCLTQLKTLYVTQDPFEEDELWALKTLAHLKKVSFGWYFGTKDLRKFLSLPEPQNELSDSEDDDIDEDL